jgi:membrane-associated phospholipid phosphatase
MPAVHTHAADPHGDAHRTPEPLEPAERLGVTCALLAMLALVFLFADAWNARWAIGGRMFRPEIALDQHVPFMPGFVFVYASYYVWLLLPLLIARARGEFYRTVLGFASMQLLALVVFVLFPTQIVRPTIAGDGVTAELLRLLYGVDRGFNLLPSLHVAHSVYVAILVRAARPAWFPWVAVGSLLISASTVLVKQHYLLDIPAGVLLALIARTSARPLHARLLAARDGIEALLARRTRKV